MLLDTRNIVVLIIAHSLHKICLQSCHKNVDLISIIMASEESMAVPMNPRKNELQSE